MLRAHTAGSLSAIVAIGSNHTGRLLISASTFAEAAFSFVDQGLDRSRKSDTSQAVALARPPAATIP